MKRLEGEVAIIAGGSGDMGSSISKLFLQEGANVMAGDIRPLKTKSSSKFASEELDCTQKDSWDQVVSKTIELFGKVTVLVNCFGVNFREPFKDQGLSSWNTIVNVNLTGVFIGIKAVTLSMQKAKKGSIINIGSLATLRGSANSPAYQASKTGLIGLTKSSALSLADKEIRCNLLCPGHVDTSFIRKNNPHSPNDWSTSIDNPENYKNRLEKIPAGRFVTPEDIAKVSLFLASEDSTMITGAIIPVDGGTNL